MTEFRNLFLEMLPRRHPSLSDTVILQTSYMSESGGCAARFSGGLPNKEREEKGERRM